MNPIVQVKNLKKTFNPGEENEVHAVNGVDMQVKKGEMVAIMGPSGSGKTTLLNCISGIDSATSGNVIVDGNDIQKLKDKPKTKYRAKKMGFIFQTFNLIPVLTALENVEMPLLVNGFSQKKATKRAKKMLDIVGLGDRMDHKPNELSGGQRQRVTVARALVHKPAIVWADEPTGNLDTETANEVMDLILELNQKYQETFVVVTHDPRVAEKTGKILKMESGKIVNGIDN